MNEVNLSICQYPMQRLTSWQAYQQKITQIVKQAAQSNAQLLLMPEYAGMEVAWLYPKGLRQQWQSSQQDLPRYYELYQQLAATHSMYIQPGTIAVSAGDEYFFNRAYLFAPNGQFCYQDKLILTPSEKRVGCVQASNEQHLFDTTIGKIGIAICYDSEFPSVIHALAAAGAQLILVPSYTDSWHGYYRVRLSCRARALENQCYVAQACANGFVSGCAFFDDTAVGSVAVFGPVDSGFPNDGIIAHNDDKLLLNVDLNFSLLDAVRNNGVTSNFKDLLTLSQSTMKTIIEKIIL